MQNKDITILRTPPKWRQDLLAKYDFSNLTRVEMLICSEIILSEYRDREKPRPSPQSQDKSEV